MNYIFRPTKNVEIYKSIEGIQKNLFNYNHDSENVDYGNDDQDVTKRS
jgi:hypothetical protein